MYVCRQYNDVPAVEKPSMEDVNLVLDLWSGLVKLTTYVQFKLMCSIRFTTSRFCFPCHMANQNGICFHMQAIIDGDARFLVGWSSSSQMAMKQTKQGRRRRRRGQGFSSCGSRTCPGDTRFKCDLCMKHTDFPSKQGLKAHISRIRLKGNLMSSVTNPNSVYFKR